MFIMNLLIQRFHRFLATSQRRQLDCRCGQPQTSKKSGPKIIKLLQL